MAGLGGNRLKVEETYCDVHPEQRLGRGVMKWSSKYGPAIQQVLRCPYPECGRQFHYDLGYFPASSNDEPDFGDLSKKPKCRKGHDLLYMLLAKVDGSLSYVCFFPECTCTAPYEPVVQEEAVV